MDYLGIVILFVVLAVVSEPIRRLVEWAIRRRRMAKDGR